MPVRDSSLEAYDSLRDTELLSRRQREVMLAVHRYFPYPQTFTRKRLAAAMGWPINRVTGRVLELIEAGFLEECGRVLEDGRNVHCLRVKARQLEMALA